MSSHNVVTQCRDRCNAVVFWFEMPMGAAGLVSTAPSAALLGGQRKLNIGQAKQFLPPRDVQEGTKLALEVRQ